MSTEEINTRNELARDIPKWTDLPFGGVNDYVKLDANAAYAIADVLIEKGYSKPRQVSTVEELDALPEFSVVARNGVPYTKTAKGWQLAGILHVYSAESLLLNNNATVLYAPDAPTETGTQA